MKPVVRALLDANLFISYLLSSNRGASAMGAIITAAASGAFTLLLTDQLANEIRDTIAERPHLAKRIASIDVDELLGALTGIAEWIPRIRERLPALSRDPDDDYLIAHAAVAAADYLVSWDYDLRDLGQIDGIKIVSPPEFLSALRDAGLVP